MRDFPEGFLFGSSTAAHQVEGGNVNNDWWAWEHAPYTTCVESSGDAIDQWHRYEEDFALLAGLGQNAHRLSLEWSRIEPAPGEYSAAALAHYRRVLGTLEQHGLTAFVTLHHFTLPRWLAERGGWLAPDAVERFARYVERVAAALGDLMPFAGTINEPQIVALMGYREGWFPPGLRNPGQFGRVTRRLIEAHAAAVQAVKSGRGDPQAGVCLQLPALRARAPGRPRVRHGVRRARARHGGRLPRGPRRRLGRRAVLHAPARRSRRRRRLRARAGGCAADADGLGDPPRGAASRDPQRRARRPAGLRDRERHRDGRRHAADRLPARPPRRRSRGRSPAASTCAASTTGPRSTTSSGPRATAPLSG